LQAFKDLAKTGSVTRDRYRKESGVPEPVWTYHFGTFAELKRQADAGPSRTVNKIHAAVARATSSKKYEPLNLERSEYGEKYLRIDKARYKTMVVASDLHDKEIDPFYNRVFQDTCARVQPDVIVLGGDVFDLPEFGKYNVDPREWDVVGRIKFVHENILAPMRASCPDTQIDLIEGNHECVTPETEILTSTGWVLADKLSKYHRVGSFDLDTHEINYEKPVALAKQDDREVYEVSSTFKCERITSNHNVIYDGTLMSLDYLTGPIMGEKMNGARFLNALHTSPKREIPVDENLVRLAMWIVTNGTFRTTEGDDGYWLSFRVPSRVARRIKYTVIPIDGLNWTMTKKGIEVSGPRMREIVELITGKTDVDDLTLWRALPDWFAALPTTYGPILARELTWASTQGFMSRKTSYYNGHGTVLGDALQLWLVTRGVPCAVNHLTNEQFILVFNPKNEMERMRGRKVTKTALGTSTVVSIQTVDGTLITRLNGRVNFTGNCRLVKHLADFSPATRAILGDLHGMTLGDLFGLSAYEVNYVAKADLKSYTERDHRKELQNNYRVYWDSVMVHHFPHARNLGLPGLNGHHHEHVVWPMYNVHRGAYEWHQLGSGHRRKASYCEGEKWHNGFAIVHVDTLTKSVNIEYVPITTFAVVGGKFYTREPSEIIT
jgi:hypothetical protein